MRVFVAYPKPARMRTFEAQPVEAARDAQHQREVRQWQHGAVKTAATPMGEAERATKTV